MHGFYYYIPEDSNEWWDRESRVRSFFAPINWLDRQFNREYSPACPPLFGLSK
jgi:hypothetical protein